jgi:hypothetical protein
MRMKNPNSVLPGGACGLLLGMLLLAPAGSLSAQTFDVGSTGALGDVVIDANTTIDLPPDGKLHYKSLTVNAGVRVSFTRNVRNTPVFILSQGDVVVNGVINVNGVVAANNDGGRGGPGGFDGGKPGFSDTPPGSGYGPGAGGGGNNGCGGALDAAGGVFGSRPGHPLNGQTYGNSFLVPLIGGSGGGGSVGSPGLGGGGGGGAILIASNTKVTVTGTIEARGGQNRTCLNGGSGGGIRLVALRVEGAGLLDARDGGNAGLGRIRVDTLERSGVQFNFQGVTSVGGNLFTFPPVVPRLDTIEVAGNTVPEGSAPLTFTLPFGSTPARTVKIQARDFGRNVPIRITLTPDAGTPVVVDAEVDNTTENPKVIEVPVNVPVNTLVTVHCWTR